jgi:hypothetical protein
MKNLEEEAKNYILHNPETLKGAKNLFELIKIAQTTNSFDSLSFENQMKFINVHGIYSWY